MKPIYNTKRTLTIHYNHRREQFTSCLRCYTPLKDRLFMHDSCWRESSQKERNRAYDLERYMKANNLSDFEMEI